jgi:hypothetical protein
MKRKVWGESDFIIKNDKVIYCNFNGKTNEKEIKYEDAPTLMKFENMARKNPHADWRYLRITALHEEEYQRQGKNYWVMVRNCNAFFTI